MLKAQCNVLIHGVGFAELRRSQVAITGNDRVRLLNGLTTNDIKRLQPGDGCESFLTNVQGKVIGHVYVFCFADMLVLDTVAGQAPEIIRALNRYVIREDVRFADRSDEWHELLVSGAKAAEVLTKLFGDNIPTHDMRHRELTFAASPVSIRRTNYAGSNTFQLSTSQSFIPSLRQALTDGGAVTCTDEAVEIARIEAGTPLFGQDITVENLPQEVDRNQVAISFTKGCYLGQETVARIDALGHVNRTLRRMRFESSDVPPPGADITKDGKTIAKITSSCFSPRLNAPLALGYVRRGQDQLGNRFSTDWGTAEVVGMPIR